MYQDDYSVRYDPDLKGWVIDIFQGFNVIETVGPTNGNVFKSRETAEAFARSL